MKRYSLGIAASFGGKKMLLTESQDFVYRWRACCLPVVQDEQEGLKFFDSVEEAKTFIPQVEARIGQPVEVIIAY